MATCIKRWVQLPVKCLGEATHSRRALSAVPSIQLRYTAAQVLHSACPTEKCQLVLQCWEQIQAAGTGLTPWPAVRDSTEQAQLEASTAGESSGPASWTRQGGWDACLDTSLHGLSVPDEPARPLKPDIVSSGSFRRPKHVPLVQYLLHALAHVELNAIHLYCDTIARFQPHELPAQGWIGM